MSGIPARSILSVKPPVKPRGKGRSWLFLLSLFLVLITGKLMGQDTTTPSYTWNKGFDLDLINVRLWDLGNIESKLAKVILAVDVNPQGEIFVLTFGNGIKKIGPTGELLDFINSNNISSPLDFAINSEGKFFVADNESNSRYVRVFSPAGAYLPNETLGDGTFGTTNNKFKGPVGLAFDAQDNLYVADHYLGDVPDVPEPSRIKIFFKDSAGRYKYNLLTQFDKVQGVPLNFPYRLAVDSKGLIYVAESGDGNGRVLVINLDESHIPSKIDEISGVADKIGSPGSLIIDKFDHIFIADFGPNVKMTKILEAVNDPVILLNMFDDVKEGIANNVFKINIYNPDRSYLKVITDQIDLAIDLAIERCGKLYVNNAILSGNTSLFSFNANLDFDLEIYERNPGYDIENPVVNSCPSNIETSADEGESHAVVNYTTPTFSDNCSAVTVNRTRGLASGSEFPLGETIVEFTASDATGNKSTCSFSVIVEATTVPLDITCPEDQTRELDENCRFTVPDLTDLASVNITDAMITQSPLAGTIISKNTTVTLTATSGDQTNSCTFELVLVDTTAPVITCPDDQTETYDPATGFVLPDYKSLAAVSDNCGTDIIQSPLAGTVITENTPVTISATDAAGNSVSCTFTVILSEILEITCPGDQTRELDENCRFTVPDLTDLAGVNITGAVITQFPLTGTIISENTTVTLTSTSGDQTSSCTFELVLVDTTVPVFECPESVTAGFEISEGYTVPDFSGLLPATDNCDTTLSYTQTPAPGSKIEEAGNYPVLLTATDASGNSESCEFSLMLTASDSFGLSCNSRVAVHPDENCIFIMPDLSDELIVTPASATLTQSIPAGTIITRDERVTVTATYGSRTTTCSILVDIVDYEYPTVTCPGPQYVSATTSEGFVLPDYTLNEEATDNCEVVAFTQQPEPGTRITESTLVRLTAEDSFGNLTSCSFMVYLSEAEKPDIKCPVDQIGEPDENCRFRVGDYRGLAEINIPGGLVTQSPAPGTQISESTEITLTLTSGNESDSCIFQLILKDTTAPVIDCPGDLTENYDPATGFILEDYRGLASVTENCGIREISQYPAPGVLITQNTQVTLSVTDAGGNVAECNFMLILSEEEVLEISCPENQMVEKDDNCSFILPDYTGMAGVNFAGALITQSPAAGTLISENTSVVLSASFNGQADQCSFEVIPKDRQKPVAGCVSGFGIGLNSGGTATLSAEEVNFNSTDNCGIVSMSISKTNFTTADAGENRVILTVTDAAGNTDTCETTVTVTVYEEPGGSFSCKSRVGLQLDATGNALLRPEDLYTGEAGNRNFSLSKSVFNCGDTGEQEVVLSWTGEGGGGSCPVVVEVKDSFSPDVRTRDISVFLNGQGQAVINPEMIDAGSTDNCGEVSLSLNRAVFSCKDEGENEVILTATDAAGNTASVTARVYVSGNCGVSSPGTEHIFIYPNPSTGPFAISVPQGMSISRLEAYDFRGRFIAARDYPEDTSVYNMDLSGLQQAVYVLKLYTNDGEKILRLIKE